MTALEEARATIDQVDRSMAALFEERMQAVMAVNAFKKEQGLPVRDPAREALMLDRNAGYITDESLRPYYREFLEAMLGVSRRYQQDH